VLPLLATNPWVSIITLFAIAWAAPNSQQIIASADRFIDRYMKEINLLKPQSVPVFLFFISFLTSVLIFAITLNVVRDAESPFIYFNF
jgi:hypothetical protein